MSEYKFGKAASIVVMTPDDPRMTALLRGYSNSEIVAVFQAALHAEMIWKDQYDDDFPYSEAELEVVAGQFIDNMDILVVAGR